jgi:hypothetical protein
MRRFLSILFIFAFLSTLVVIPASSAIESPYKLISGGCITDVSMKSSSTVLEDVNYFTATVTSHIQGVSSRPAIPYDVYGAIGSEDTRMFVYSVGSSSNLDYAEHTVLDIVKQFEADNPAWNAVAAINGGFFDNETSKSSSRGETEDISIENGNVYKGSFGPAGGRGMVGTTADGDVVYYTYGQAYFDRGWGQAMVTRSSHTVRVLDEEKQILEEHQVYADKDITAGQPILLTKHSNAVDLSGYTVFVVKCDTYRRAHIASLGLEMGTLGYFIEGDIVEIRAGKAGDTIMSGYVILAFPPSFNVSSLPIGTHLKCERTVVGTWADVTNAVGFKQMILAEGNILLKNCYGTYNKNGNKAETLVWTDDIYDYPHCWKHRTALGFKADGSPVLLVAKKSSDTGSNKNLGASYYELGEQLKSLGCVNGFLLDGGGSSTFVLRNESGSFDVVFKGEGTNGRKVGNAVILAVRDPSVPLPGETHSVSGRFTSYASTGNATLKLMSGSEVVSTLTLGKTNDIGLVSRAFTFEKVKRGTYDLVIEQSGHLSCTIKGIVVGADNIDMTMSTNSAASIIILPAGDINNDGCIDLKDVTLLTSSNTYGKTYNEAITKLADINGDECFDLKDLVILTSDANYGKAKIEIPY